MTAATDLPRVSTFDAVPSAQFPLQPLSPAERLAFRRDGVVLLRNALPYSWIERLEGAMERAIYQPSFIARMASDPSAGYLMETFLWKRDDDVRDAAFFSPLPRLAQALLESEHLHFFGDQTTTKKAGNSTPTPWHHDLTFWPIRGEQIVSFWCPVDLVTKDSGGLEFVAGSHRWPNRYKAVYPPTVGGRLRPDPNQQLVNPALEDVPPIEELRDEHRILSWEMQPGDVLAFHPLVLHGSEGDRHTSLDRRAITLRYTGEDVTFQPGPHTSPIPYPHGRRVGGSLGGPVFPQVLPARIPGECGRRDRGPERPLPRALFDLMWRPTLAAWVATPVAPWVAAWGRWLGSSETPRG